MLRIQEAQNPDARSRRLSVWAVGAVGAAAQRRPGGRWQ